MGINILWLIIGATVIVSMMAFNNQELRSKMLFIPFLVKRDKEVYRIGSHMLIHADYAHLGFNMFSLYMLGNVLLINGNFVNGGELNYVGASPGFMRTYGDFAGQVHFFILYLLGGLFATLIPMIRRQNDPYYSSLGASGAVSAVVFAAMIWNPHMELGLLFIPIYIPAYIFAPLFILFEIFLDRRGGTGVAHDAHIGGALFGILYVLIINIEKGKEFIQLIF